MGGYRWKFIVKQGRIILGCSQPPGDVRLISLHLFDDKILKVGGWGSTLHTYIIYIYVSSIVSSGATVQFPGATFPREERERRFDFVDMIPQREIRSLILEYSGTRPFSRTGTSGTRLRLILVEFAIVVHYSRRNILLSFSLFAEGK